MLLTYKEKSLVVVRSREVPTSRPNKRLTPRCGRYCRFESQKLFSPLPAPHVRPSYRKKLLSHCPNRMIEARTSIVPTTKATNDKRATAIAKPLKIILHHHHRFVVGPSITYGCCHVWTLERPRFTSARFVKYENPSANAAKATPAANHKRLLETSVICLTVTRPWPTTRPPMNASAETAAPPLTSMSVLI